jgi:hypothetical protein
MPTSRAAGTDRSARREVPEANLSGWGHGVRNIGFYEESMPRVNCIIGDVGRSKWRGKCARSSTE